MLEHLEKWMYINDIENEKLKEASKIIEKDNIEPIILSSKAYILKHFYDLINDKITMEDFYTIWDTYSNIDTNIESFIKNPYDFLNYIENEEESNQKLYIIDNIFSWNSKRKDIFYI